jgi:hypothetical protein
MSKATAREQARDKAQEISDLANLIRNAVDAGLYRSAQEKLDLLAHEIADLIRSPEPATTDRAASTRL